MTFERQTGNRRFLIVKVGEQKPEKNLFDESAMEDIRQSWDGSCLYLEE